MAGTRSNATDVRDSIEAKIDKENNDVEMADAPADQDAPVNQPDEDDEDGDGEDDDDADADADGDDDDLDPSDFARLIDKLQRYLSEFQEKYVLPRRMPRCTLVLEPWLTTCELQRRGDRSRIPEDP